MNIQSRLIPFSPVADTEIHFQWKWHQGIALIDYQVKGAVQSLALDDSTPKGRQDELWKNTCFEFFLKPFGGKSYFEANLAVSGAWNFYQLDDYRKNLRPVVECPAPHVLYKHEEDKLHLHVDWDLKWLQKRSSVSGPILLNPSVVLKNLKNEASYWSVSHSQEKPDFHHADQFQLSFALEDV